MRLKMSKLDLFNVYLNERLKAAAVEIVGAVERTITEYQEELSRSKEENNRLRVLLDFKTQTPSQRTDIQQVPPEWQHLNVLAEHQRAEKGMCSALTFLKRSKLTPMENATQSQKTTVPLSPYQKDFQDIPQLRVKTVEVKMRWSMREYRQGPS
ncbi:hypothetical protein UPYG_G00334630 [Umbra pygmaea]|uniref:Uncharacterized protein n=1 Tax=Umbra pygmaea TaxID=75934 RepID=A0ABD0VWJ9_UMBPY